MGVIVNGLHVKWMAYERTATDGKTLTVTFSEKKPAPVAPKTRKPRKASDGSV